MCFRAAAAFCLAATFGALQSASPAQAQETGENSENLQLSAAQLFEFADAARDRGDFTAAEAAYRALTQDPDLEMRTEARFRLALLYSEHMDRKRDAAVLLRRILDDKPDAAAVRLHLARLLTEMGEYRDARRELRAVQASGLPPEVEQRVRFFANALSATKRIGGGLELALAPTTNINRATRSDTLGTVIGDFDLSEDAQAKSGLGVSLKGQTYARLPVSAKTDMLLRASGSADVYRDSDFDDFDISLQAGPQWRSGSDRLSLSAAVNWRWYGLDPFTVSFGGTGNWQHPLSGRSQLRVDASVLREVNRQNSLETGERYGLSTGIDHAFSARTGGGLVLSGNRKVAADSAYSTTTGGSSGYLYREFGRTTAVLNVSWRHLEADARLFLYPERRKEDDLALSLSGTFRSLTVGTLAPIVRVGYERNWSTIEIYDFDRVSAEIGITTAF